MAITLGNLRTFCRETASPDASDTTAEREFMVWINAALHRLYTERSWDVALREQKITILPEETAADLTVTEGSLNLTRVGGGVFTAKWLSERWELWIDGIETTTFELASIGSAPANNTAVMRTGDEYPGASDTGVTYYFRKTKYALPLARQIFRVRDVESKIEIPIVSPEQFDEHRNCYPTQQTARVEIVTFRRGKVEIWPFPTNADEYPKLLVSYHVGHSRMADGDADATEVAWDEVDRDLLEKAILLEAAVTLGANAPVPYPIALAEYQQRLARGMQISQKRNMAGPLGVRAPGPIPADPRRPRWLPGTEIIQP